MVRAIMIVEMAGKPAQHVKEVLANHIAVLDKVNDLRVHTIKISEPKEIENSNGLFTCFAEADFESDNFARLSETMFDFMPSSVEIIEPARVNLEAAHATDLLNNISGRMHRYDEIAKIAQFRIKQLEEELRVLKESSNKESIKKPSKKKSSKKKLVKKKARKK